MSIQQKVSEGKCLDDLATLVIKCEALGISRAGPHSDVAWFLKELEAGMHFRFSAHDVAIRKWVRENRYYIDDKLRDECLDFIAMFQAACYYWDPREYPVMFFNVAANILKLLPPGYPDIPKVGLLLKLRGTVRNWRSLGL